MMSAYLPLLVLLFAGLTAPAVAQDAGVAATPTPTPGAEPTPTPGAPAAAEPWAGASGTTAPPPPAFLDTTDRRIADERPPPTDAQVAALREMEAEVDQFSKIGTSYRDTVLSLVRREYLRQRRARDQGYARQIRAEERLQNEARERAILLFERFIARYPNDPTYTPDAMFRLGELYFERSALSYQEAYDAAQAVRDSGGEPPPIADYPDYAPTIDLYQRLVQTFPDYRRIDGVYYLIGYCLVEMGRSDEARLAWLTLVCSNHYSYDPAAYAAERAAAAEAAAAAGEGQGEGEGEGAEHPALELDAPTFVAQAGPFVDPYSDCTPVRADAQFVSETWFRIGEFHFDDYSGDNSLDLAISAYNRILVDPEDRNYNLALYKVAWAYYRASRYPEAIRHFSMLVQWSDDERLRTGRAGSELRPEAVQYLAIAFAYDDWNENQAPDPTEGGATGIQRIQDPQLMPQDRPWTPEVYFALGNVYFDENKLPDAIAVWEMALQRWPNHERAPELTNMIARAYTRAQEMERAIDYRARLGDFGEGSDWWNSNVDHPAEQRRAEQLAENALIGTAVHYHQEAQRQRRQCVEQQDPALCRASQENYGLAARGYREYLRRYPNNPQAYELRYNLADALYWSEDYEQAAIEYAAVRDSNLDDGHLSEAARRVVEAIKQLADREVEAGRLTIREQPPEPQGQPPQVMPIAMPELLQRLAQAREMYLARVDERADTENVREAYDYNNALLLYVYGYWPQARDRFLSIFDERCSGPLADETGQVAWLNLNNMAVSMNDRAEVERLSTELRSRRCTFSSGATGPIDINCAEPENRDQPQCVANVQLTNIRYSRAVEVFDQAERATGADQRRLYEQAATMLVQAVNDEPNHPQAPIALERAAIALERTSRFESAARLYQRIVDEVAPRRGADDEEQGRLDAILANAYFRLAFNANRFFDFGRAVDNYRLLADSPRFASSTNPAVVEKREDALINAAVILERQQQYSQAAQYYRRAAAILRDPAERQNAYYRIAEMAFKQQSWTSAVTEMRAFISRYASDRAAGELVVQAYWRIAQARQSARARATEYTSALTDVVNAFARSGQPASSMAAEYAAHAKFLLVDGSIQSFESFAIRPGSPRTMEAYVNGIKGQIDEGARTAQGLVGGYEPILGYRRPTWTIATYVRQGRVYEVLARAVLNTPFAMPADLASRLRRVSADQRDQIRLEVETTIQGVLDQRVRPIECFAVARYALAARAARAGNINNEYTQIAVERLQAYGEERIAECIAEAQRNDASFAAYTTGEFSRAPRGENLEMPPDAAPPPLVGAEGR